MTAVRCPRVLALPIEVEGEESTTIEEARYILYTDSISTPNPQ